MAPSWSRSDEIVAQLQDFAPIPHPGGPLVDPRRCASTPPARPRACGGPALEKARFGLSTQITARIAAESAAPANRGGLSFSPQTRIPELDKTKQTVIKRNRNKSALDECALRMSRRRSIEC